VFTILFFPQISQAIESRKIEKLIEGAQSPAEFDATVADLVNFLYYVGEPIRSRRQEIGLWVLVFLGILYVLTTLLGREFSKDYH
jgi:cytochrome c1